MQGIRSPPHIRFDCFSFGIARARPNRSQDRKGFYLEKVLIGDNFEKKFEPLTVDLWKQCRTFLQCRLTQHRLAQGNPRKQIQAYSFSFRFFSFYSGMDRETTVTSNFVDEKEAASYSKATATLMFVLCFILIFCSV